MEIDSVVVKEVYWSLLLDVEGCSCATKNSSIILLYKLSTTKLIQISYVR